jgi:hypothetical protein
MSVSELPNSGLQLAAIRQVTWLPAAVVARFAEAPLATIVLLPPVWHADEVSVGLMRPQLKPQTLG